MIELVLIALFRILLAKVFLEKLWKIGTYNQFSSSFTISDPLYQDLFLQVVQNIIVGIAYHCF